MISNGQIKRLLHQTAGDATDILLRDEVRAFARAVWSHGRDAGVEELERLRKEDEIKAVANQALLDEVARLRKSLAAMQGHVLEMCRVFNVPLPEDSLNDARAALENKYGR